MKTNLLVVLVIAIVIVSGTTRLSPRNLMLIGDNGYQWLFNALTNLGWKVNVAKDKMKAVSKLKDDFTFEDIFGGLGGDDKYGCADGMNVVQRVLNVCLDGTGKGCKLKCKVTMGIQFDKKVNSKMIEDNFDLKVGAAELKNYGIVPLHIQINDNIFVSKKSGQSIKNPADQCAQLLGAPTGNAPATTGGDGKSICPEHPTEALDLIMVIINILKSMKVFNYFEMVEAKNKAIKIQTVKKDTKITYLFDMTIKVKSEIVCTFEITRDVFKDTITGLKVTGKDPACQGLLQGPGSEDNSWLVYPLKFDYRYDAYTIQMLLDILFEVKLIKEHQLNYQMNTHALLLSSADAKEITFTIKFFVSQKIYCVFTFKRNLSKREITSFDAKANGAKECQDLVIQPSPIPPAIGYPIVPKETSGGGLGKCPDVYNLIPNFSTTQLQILVATNVIVPEVMTAASEPAILCETKMDQKLLGYQLTVNQVTKSKKNCVFYFTKNNENTLLYSFQLQPASDKECSALLIKAGKFPIKIPSPLITRKKCPEAYFLVDFFKNEQVQILVKSGLLVPQALKYAEVENDITCETEMTMELYLGYYIGIPLKPKKYCIFYYAKNNENTWIYVFSNVSDPSMKKECDALMAKPGKVPVKIPSDKPDDKPVDKVPKPANTNTLPPEKKGPTRLGDCTEAFGNPVYYELDENLPYPKEFADCGKDWKELWKNIFPNFCEYSQKKPIFMYDFEDHGVLLRSQDLKVCTRKAPKCNKPDMCFNIVFKKGRDESRLKGYGTDQELYCDYTINDFSKMKSPLPGSGYNQYYCQYILGDYVDTSTKKWSLGKRMLENTAVREFV